MPKAAAPALPLLGTGRGRSEGDAVALSQALTLSSIELSKSDGQLWPKCFHPEGCCWQVTSGYQNLPPPTRTSRGATVGPLPLTFYPRYTRIYSDVLRRSSFSLA